MAEIVLLTGTLVVVTLSSIAQIYRNRKLKLAIDQQTTQINDLKTLLMTNQTSPVNPEEIYGTLPESTRTESPYLDIQIPLSISSKSSKPLNRSSSNSTPRPRSRSNSQSMEIDSLQSSKDTSPKGSRVKRLSGNFTPQLETIESKRVKVPNLLLGSPRGGAQQGASRSGSRLVRKRI